MFFVKRTAPALALMLCALLISAPAVDAATILKLDLGSVSPDVRFDGTEFSTVSDGNAATTGDQDTGVLFEDFLDGIESDILPSDASFTLDGLMASGSAVVFGGSLALQNFTGGTFSLYDPSNTLLLSGNLANSALTGSIGLPSGALFTTSFGSVTGGTLAPYIATNTLTLSMNLTGIMSDNGDSGFSVAIGPGGSPPLFEVGDLGPFNADGQISIDAEFIPEPTTSAMLAAAASLILAGCRRNRAIH